MELTGPPHGHRTRWGREGTRWAAKKGRRRFDRAGSLRRTAFPGRPTEFGHQLRPTPRLTPCAQKSDRLNGLTGRAEVTGVAFVMKFGMRVTSSIVSIWSPGRTTLLQ